jgi:RimJ/RimL family protein N-acetyltransferase
MHVATLPTDELLTYLTSVDQRDHVAIGASVESPDLKTERGVGVARFVRLEGSRDTAEAAITVVDDMQRKGVGTVLLVELLRAAKARGIRTIRAEVLADNDTMRMILERAGATKVPAESGEGTIAYDLSIDDARSAEKPAPSFFEVLRGAAETMALRFRR